MKSIAFYPIIVIESLVKNPMFILSIIEKIMLVRVREGGLFMRIDIQSFLDDLQIMPVCNSKCLADVLALAVEQPALLETHRLFYRYAVSNNLYTSTVTAMVKRALCSAQNTALMETLTGTDGWDVHPERIAVLRELLEKQWQFHDYTLLQEPQRSICRLMDNLHLRPTHRGHAYMVYALSLSLENPSLLQSGEVWQKTAAHYQIPVSQVTGTLGSFVQSIRATGALTKLIGISSGYARHYAKLAAAMYWHLTGRRLTFCYHLSSTFMEEDIQILKDLSNGI